jgi:hypothetical protein
MQLVKYECGCIGLPPDASNWAIIFRTCDYDGRDDGTCVIRRNMSSSTPDGKRSFKGLSEEESQQVLSRLGQLVYLGHEMEHLRHILGTSKEQMPSERHD